nr:tripartite motif-containing protein 59-like [Lytechinus pictus]
MYPPGSVTDISYRFRRFEERSLILSCSHTFCKTCLDNLLECHGNCQIRCPVCRAVTQVPNQDVGKLQVNLALKSLIDDTEGQPQICTNCKSNDNPHADVYCQDCACCFCSTCRRFTCFRCGVMEHKDEGHHVVEAATYEDKHMESIEDLKSKVEKKQSCFQKYIDFKDEQSKSVDNAKKQCKSDINKAYDDAVRQLSKKRESLLREVKETSEGVKKELESMKTTAQKHTNQLTTLAEMVINKTKIPLDMDTLATHDTLCKELREVFDQNDPDYEQPRKSGIKGKSVNFERNVGVDELGLGKIVNVALPTNKVFDEKDVSLPTNKIVNVKKVALPNKGRMNAMVGTPDGRMEVGCDTGGISIISSDGKLQQTVLKDVKIDGAGFHSDGRCVVTDSNDITLYTPEYTKLNVMFKTLSRDEGGASHLTVDGIRLSLGRHLDNYFGKSIML